MKLDLILTYDGTKGQQRNNLPFVVEILKDKCTLIDFIAATLSDEDKQDLIKISCCVQWFTPYEKYKKIPKWYNECKGKIWVDDLENWRKAMGIESKVSKDYINQFETANS